MLASGVLDHLEDLKREGSLTLLDSELEEEAVLDLSGLPMNVDKSREARAVRSILRA